MYDSGVDVTSNKSSDKSDKNKDRLGQTVSTFLASIARLGVDWRFTFRNSIAESELFDFILDHVYDGISTNQVINQDQDQDQDEDRVAFEGVNLNRDRGSVKGMTSLTASKILFAMGTSGFNKPDPSPRPGPRSGPESKNHRLLKSPYRSGSGTSSLTASTGTGTGTDTDTDTDTDTLQTNTSNSTLYSNNSYNNNWKKQSLVLDALVDTVLRTSPGEHLSIPTQVSRLRDITETTTSLARGT